MVDRTLPTLNTTAAPADNSIFLIRRNGQTEDESVTGADLKSYFSNAPAISGGTIDNAVIGGTTPAAGSFTALTANTIDTGQGAVECYAMDQAVQTSDSVSFSALTLTTDLAVAHGGTGASTASGARTNLGLGSAAVQDDTYFLQVSNNLSDLNNAGTARTNLGLGSLATQNTINNGDWSGTDLAVANGGTGASTAGDARTNLGLVIGTDVQAQDAGLQSIAGLTTAADTMIYTTASDTYATTSLTSFARSLLDDSSASTARSTLGLGSIATQAASNVTITGGSITGITDLAVADGGTGASTAGGARTNLGLGSIATQDANNVTISGGSISGIADLAIADGGTGASTASGARTNLDVYSTSEVYTQAETDTEIAAAIPSIQETDTSPSGTSIDWAIPAGVTEIEIYGVDLSTDGTGIPMIQLGDSGGIETSGYVGNNSDDQGNSDQFSSGFELSQYGSAANVNQFRAVLTRLNDTSDLWFFVDLFARTDSTHSGEGVGRKYLTADLTTVRLTTDTGTPDFDAGEVYVRYRG